MAVRKSVLILLAIGFVGWGTVQTLLLKYSDLLSATDNYPYHTVADPDRVCVPFTLAASGENNNNNNSINITRSGRTSHSMFSSSSDREDNRLGCVPVYLRLYYSFGHPFVQAFFMFCAEAFCLVIYGVYYWYRRKVKKVPKEALQYGVDIPKPHNLLVYFLSGGADFFASIIQNIGMTMTHASLYQMLRGAVIVYIAILSRYWLKRRYNKVEKVGMGIVIIGLTLVGLSSLVGQGGGGSNSSSSSSTTSTEDEANTNRQLIGNFLVLSAQVLHAYQGVCEERLAKLYDIPPLMVVGMEGIYGMGLSVMMLTILQCIPIRDRTYHIEKIEEYIPFKEYFSFNSAVGQAEGETVENVYQTLLSLPPNETSHSITNQAWIQEYFKGNQNTLEGECRASRLTDGIKERDASTQPQPQRGTLQVPLDDVLLTFSQMAHCTSCTVTILFYILAGAFYNFCQISIIRHLSAGAAVMMGSLRNISVWLICFLVLPHIFGERFNILQCLGFVGLVVGNLLFQRVWITSFNEVLPESVVDRFAFFLKDRREATTTTAAEEVTIVGDEKTNTEWKGEEKEMDPILDNSKEVLPL